MSQDNSVKIFFRFYSDILDAETVETMHASVVDEAYGYYKIENIPFYVEKLATGDVVWAEYKDTEGMLAYRKTVQHSGNSTVHVIILDEEYDIDVIRELFADMGCATAKLTDKYFAMEVPAAVDYFMIKRKLDDLEQVNILDYAESGLSAKHEYRNVSF